MSPADPSKSAERLRWSFLQAAARRSFGVDLRSLALLRIGLGVLLLSDLIIRAQSLSAHYTDQGVFPRHARIAIYQSSDPTAQASYWWSLHMLSGQWWFQCLLFALAAAAAFSLLVGWRTRLATIISWVLLVSLHSRFAELLSGGDVLLRLLLFWSMFLPLGARASLDALSAKSPQPAEPAGRYLSVATAALLLQIALVYFVNALVKTGPEWTQDFTAIYYALNFDLYVTSFGKSWLNYPRLLSWLTAVTYYWEFIGPLIALCPFANRWCRGIAISGFVTFHLSLACCLHLGLFPWVAIAAWTVFLPAEFWQACSRGLPNLRQQRSSIIGFLHKHAHVLVHWAKPPQLRPNRWVQTLAGIALLYVIGLNVRSVQQAIVAEPASETVTETSLWEIPGFALRLEQNWNMFAPRPTTEDGWFVMRGLLQDGTEVNLWHPNRPLRLEKPDLISAEFPDHRWRKYIANFRWDRDHEQLGYLADWLRQRWPNQQRANQQWANQQRANQQRANHQWANRQEETRAHNGRSGRQDPARDVVHVDILFFLEHTPPPGQTPAAIEVWLLGSFDYASPPGGTLRR